MPLALAWVTTSARPAFSGVGAALMPSSLISAITMFMHVSTGVVAGSCPTGPHTSGGIYVGRNGMTCGPITHERYVMGIRRVAARAAGREHWEDTETVHGVVYRT